MILTKARFAIAALVSALAGAAVPTAIVLQGEGNVQYMPRLVQTPDSICLADGAANRDSVGKFHLKSTKPTAYQTRSSARLDALFAFRCVNFTVVVDTVVSDTAPASPIRVSLTNQSAIDTLRIRPIEPFMLFFTVQIDSSGVAIGDSAFVSLSDTSLAKLYRNKAAGRYEVYTLTSHTKSGTLTIRAQYGEVISSYHIFVKGTDFPAPPPTGPDTVASLFLLFADTTLADPTVWNNPTIGQTRDICNGYVSARGLRGLVFHNVPTTADLSQPDLTVPNYTVCNRVALKKFGALTGETYYTDSPIPMVPDQVYPKGGAPVSTATGVRIT